MGELVSHLYWTCRGSPGCQWWGAASYGQRRGGRANEGMLMPALDGMRVLDFTQYEAGPSCCQYLAWLGADVVKIEPPRGEPGRKTGAPNGGKAQYFENYNANKRSVVVDVSTEVGRDLVCRLVTGFDVFVENQGPRVMEKLRLDPLTLHAVHPKLIYARIKGYGLSGPYADYRSF